MDRNVAKSFFINRDLNFERVLICSSSTSSTKSLFCSNIGTHISGLLFANRTVELNPPLARSNMLFSSFSFASTVSAKANELIWDMWDT